MHDSRMYANFQSGSHLTHNRKTLPHTADSQEAAWAVQGAKAAAAARISIMPDGTAAAVHVYILNARIQASHPEQNDFAMHCCCSIQQATTHLAARHSLADKLANKTKLEALKSDFCTCCCQVHNREHLRPLSTVEWQT